MRLSSTPVAILCSLLAAALAAPRANAGLVAYWDFNNSNLQVSQGAGTLTTTIPTMSGGAGYDFTNDGTSLNLLTGDTSGNALRLKSNAENGKSLTFSISTLGLNDLVLTFATNGNSPGFSSNEVSYSADGGVSFIPFATYGPASSSYGLETFDFSSVLELNDNPNVEVRITLGGATSNGGQNRLDNVQFNAAAISTPEPSTLALLTLGSVALASWCRRKKRSVA